MSDQPAFTIAELGARFGAQLSQAYAEIITLEKRLEGQAKTINEMASNETRLVDHIHDLEQQLDQLKAAKRAGGTAQMAAEGKAIIQQGRKDIGLADAEAAAALGSVNA